MSTLRIVKPGLMTTVQDRGRWGYQSYGVPVAGAMDQVSHRLANAIVANPPDAATLEVTLTGPEIDFEDERAVAVSGAEFELTVDGRAVPMNEPIVVSAGSRVRFGARRRGARAYLAVDGGIDVPIVFGSRATHLSSRMGGVDGRALAAGDVLPLGTPHRQRTRLQIDIPTEWFSARSPIRVMSGPNQELFTADALQVLASAPYVVATDSNRMGYRLNGPALSQTRGGDIISDATPLGAVQVPSAGQPIVLMADRQTTGGYPKIATVISADISRLGQLAPGDALTFTICSERDALAALVEQERRLTAAESGRP